MKQTNYHLFDFMDFDPLLEKDEALWKAYAPSKIEERDGDIIVTIPYQKQLHQEDMAPDTSAPQQSFDLIVRAYEPNIVRYDGGRRYVAILTRYQATASSLYMW